MPASLAPLRITSRPGRVAVIGAGLVGMSSAIWLQKAGHDVTLIDRNDPLDLESWKTAASFGNACTFAPAAILPVAMPGILAQVPKLLADPDGPLALRWADLPALTPWLYHFLRASRKSRVAEIAEILGRLMQSAAEAQAALLDDTRAQDLTRTSGLLYLYKSAAAYEASRSGHALRAQNGVEMTLLDREQIRAREPGLKPVYHCGVTFDTSWHFDTPARYARRLAETFLSRGGTFLRTSIQEIRPEPSDIRLTTGGEPASFDQAVIACGAWSKPLARSIGDRVPLDTERGYHLLFPEAATRLNGPVCFAEHGFYMTPTEEGLRCAGTVELGGLDKPPRRNRLEVIRRVASGLVEGIGTPTRSWMGFRPSMPDSLPVIGQSPSDRRIIHAYGHGHIGLTLSSITGRLVAELASGQSPSVDLTPFRPDRF